MLIFWIRPPWKTPCYLLPLEGHVVSLVHAAVPGYVDVWCPCGWMNCFTVGGHINVCGPWHNLRPWCCLRPVPLESMLRSVVHVTNIDPVNVIGLCCHMKLWWYRRSMLTQWANKCFQWLSFNDYVSFLFPEREKTLHYTFN